MTDLVSAPTTTSPGVGSAHGGADSGRARRVGNYAGLLPFHVYVLIFLVAPTVIVTMGAFSTSGGGFTLDNLRAIVTRHDFMDAFVASIELSAVTAIGGAIFGGLLAWAVVRGDPDGLFRQLVIAGAGVLAQFGGVMLAFAFFATVGPRGFVSQLFASAAHLNLDPLWLYSLTGLGVVYTYFQIPLMLIVFLPSLDGLRQEWYDASASLGGGAWAFWRYVGGPILAPSFLGALLLLFTNAFSAYATAAAIISQGCTLVTLQIACQMQSEIILGQENVGKALALGMIVIVSAVMAIYALIQRRASRWAK